MRDEGTRCPNCGSGEPAWIHDQLCSELIGSLERLARAKEDNA